ncbi:MAG: biotin/lipoyl-binding protein, partial [Bacteroidetes bacterium]|nr:biotin/lipoyl-binding protein [Bacteroidota bacterium]
MRGKLLIAALALASCQSKQETYTIESKPIVESVYASARLRAEGQYDLSTAVGGRVIALLKKEGDQVQAGELIAVLEADKAQAQLAGAEAALRAADG